MGLFKKAKRFEDAPAKRQMLSEEDEEQVEESENVVDLQAMNQWQKEIEQFLQQEIFDIKKRLARLEAR